MKRAGCLLVGLLGVVAATYVTSAAAQRIKHVQAPEDKVLADGVIVKMKPAAIRAAMTAGTASAMSARAGIKLSARSQLATGAVVFEPVDAGSDARVVAARLREDPDVEYAVPNIIVHSAQTVPADPRFLEQWGLKHSSQAAGGASLTTAWPMTQGSNTIVVAVVDSGIRPGHPDLAGRLLPGYDFVSGDRNAVNGVPANWYSADGNGRDADPTDPGDYIDATMLAQLPPAFVSAAGLGTRPSSWHGTHVAGTIGAGANNGVGGVGVDWVARILPVRALGRGGSGSLADILAGIEWAAGLAVPGVPINPTPAHVINLSLGSSGSCSAAYQDTINKVVAARKIIVAATGNEQAPVSQPANCNGVIAVTAHAADGDNASYANIGPEVVISAPGGGCGFVSETGSAYASGETGWTVLACASCHSLNTLRSQITARSPTGLTRSKALSALNAALTGSDLDGAATGMQSFAYLSTTQRSALADYVGNYPACLGPSDGILSTLNTSTSGPGAEGYGFKQGTSMATPHVSGVVALMLSISPNLPLSTVRSVLQSTARPHPAGSTCTVLTGVCGAGLLDAEAAVRMVQSNKPTVLVNTVMQVVRPSTAVQVNATASSSRSLSYQWSQLSGPTVAINNPLGLASGFTAPPTGTVGLEFKAFDSLGYEARTTTSVRVNSPPVIAAIAPVSTQVGSTVTGRLSATDADGDRIVFVATSIPSGMAVNADTGEFAWTPTAVTDWTFTALAADSMGNGTPVSARFVATTPAPAGGSSSAVAPSGGGGGGSVGLETLALLLLSPLVAHARGRRGVRMTRPITPFKSTRRS